MNLYWLEYSYEFIIWGIYGELLDYIVSGDKIDEFLEEIEKFFDELFDLEVVSKLDFLVELM